MEVAYRSKHFFPRLQIQGLLCCTLCFWKRKRQIMKPCASCLNVARGGLAQSRSQSLGSIHTFVGRLVTTSHIKVF